MPRKSTSTDVATISGDPLPYEDLVPGLRGIVDRFKASADSQKALPHIGLAISCLEDILKDGGPDGMLPRVQRYHLIAKYVDIIVKAINIDDKMTERNRTKYTYEQLQTFVEGMYDDMAAEEPDRRVMERVGARFARRLKLFQGLVAKQLTTGRAPDNDTEEGDKP